MKFTRDDISKIKSKRSQSNIAFFIAFIILLVIVYFMKSSTPVFLEGIAYFFLAITGYVVYDMFFGDNLRKDLKNQVKIITKVKVVDKNIKNRGGSLSPSTYYELKFDGNADIKTYEVKRKIYDKINIGTLLI